LVLKMVANRLWKQLIFRSKFKYRRTAPDPPSGEHLPLDSLIELVEIDSSSQDVKGTLTTECREALRTTLKKAISKLIGWQSIVRPCLRCYGVHTLLISSVGTAKKPAVIHFTAG